MAEGICDKGCVVTLEVDEKIAKVAQKGFDGSNVGHKIKMIVGSAHQEMKQLQESGDKFDIVFIDVITFIFNMFIIIKNNIINSTNYRAALAQKSLSYNSSMPIQMPSQSSLSTFHWILCAHLLTSALYLIPVCLERSNQPHLPRPS